MTIYLLLYRPRFKNVWRTLLREPYIISAHRLRTMMDLLPVLPFGSENFNKDSVYFYVRSYTFTVDDFTFVLGKMLDESYDMNDKIYLWMEMADRIDGDASTTTWTIRYCGKTQGFP